MKMHTKHLLNAVVVLLLMGGVAAHAHPKSAAVKAAERKLNDQAYVARQAAIEGGFEKFKAKTFKESFKGGVYIVDGDVPIVGEQGLREFYDNEIVLDWKLPKFGYILNGRSAHLIANTVDGAPKIWDNVQKMNLTYCVSTSFQGRYNQVVQAMREATKAWEDASNVRFVHVSALDNSCSNATQGVLFDVNPINLPNGEYLARAFFPGYEREQRSVIIDTSAFMLPPGSNLKLVGLLRHELGHTLSFRHEHIRPEAQQVSGQCQESPDWAPLTPYDAMSVMHYPQCKGRGDGALSLTEDDKLGAACLYGAPAGVAFDQSACLFRY
jgi:hypothetical protein